MAYIINDDCVACGTCIDECPTASISEGEIYVINPETCIDCGACSDVCPTGVMRRNLLGNAAILQSKWSGGNCFLRLRY